MRNLNPPPPRQDASKLGTANLSPFYLYSLAAFYSIFKKVFTTNMACIYSLKNIVKTKASLAYVWKEKLKFFKNKQAPPHLLNYTNYI